MFNKTIFAAGAISLLVSGLVTSAHAANGSTTVRDHRTQVTVRDHRTKPKVTVRDHRTKKVIRDHRTKKVIRDHRSKRRNEVVVVKRRKVSCYSGKEKLWWKGFKRINSFDCKGKIFGYRAYKGNGIYNASMSAYTGKMSIKFIGFAH